MFIIIVIMTIIITIVFVFGVYTEDSYYHVKIIQASRDLLVKLIIYSGNQKIALIS